MKTFRQVKRLKVQNKAQKLPGFTLVEVILVLGIAGLMLVGLISTSFSTIARQRYNDTLRSFAEYLRRVYDEVLSPQSLGDDSGAGAAVGIGNSSDRAILGKIVVFGLKDNGNRVYSATLAGAADINRAPSAGFIKDISDIDETTEKPYSTNTSIVCSSVEYYDLLWEGQLRQANDGYEGDSFSNLFKGTMIIARTPTSATIHTIFARNIIYDIADHCSAANDALRDDLREQYSGFDSGSNQHFKINENTNICVWSENSSVFREIRIAADGRNTSAVWLRPAETNTEEDGESGNQCEEP